MRAPLSLRAGPLRNRVDPFGDLRAVAQRGLFTGNRGCLMDGAGAVVRHHRGNLWITCLLEFRGRRVGLARPGRWTPVFFLDDAVALAAGHRPCGECRHVAYLAYRDAVAAAVGAPVRAGDLNRRLAAERLRRGRGLRCSRSNTASYPRSRWLPWLGLRGRSTTGSAADRSRGIRQIHHSGASLHQ